MDYFSQFVTDFEGKKRRNSFFRRFRIFERGSKTKAYACNRNFNEDKNAHNDFTLKR